MFSDTHFHFYNIAKEEKSDFCRTMLETMAENNVFFAMDIGTKCDDLFLRLDEFEKTLNLVENQEIRTKIENFIYFSAGIWPDPESIKNRFEAVKILEQNINKFISSGKKFSKKLVAIGEGGIDHHWNVNNADHRNADDFDKNMFSGETELFLLQLNLASKMDLPFVIHSRDAFEGTLNCVKESKHTKGILHCCSYGLDEVKKFLDLGYFISFSGSITYTKKSKLEEMFSLLRYVPDDRILLETDSPYLAPVPMRGNKNNPNFINHTYSFAANSREISVEKLCNLVDQNCKNLFSLDCKSL